ncbi:MULTISPECIES: hypothetical protein [Alteribacter]|uniref:hypothetical protein n=1 Tax=Alteribacter TaxID=2823237 RepID=UPI0016062FCD|nr:MULTISPECIES: hypothetical protein [Alteribacter]MBM7096069.1 hypothetical protein [Alteribacter salitolerans]
MNMEEPMVQCPNCRNHYPIQSVLTAQSNQNVIFECPDCDYEKRNIQTSKG